MSPKLELQILTYVNKDTGKSTDLMLHIPIQVPINNKGNVDFNYINTQPTIACNSENALNVVLDIISEKNM